MYSMKCQCELVQQAILYNRVVNLEAIEQEKLNDLNNTMFVRTGEVETRNFPTQSLKLHVN